MLLNTTSSFKKDDIITLKNILGEEIMCKFVEEDSTHYTISDPWALGMSQQGMSLMPPVVSGDMSGTVQFAKAHCMWAVKADEKFVPGFIEHISGIAVIPKGSKIIT